MADNHAANVLPAIREIAASGASLHQIAEIRVELGDPACADAYREALGLAP